MDGCVKQNSRSAEKGKTCVCFGLSRGLVVLHNIALLGNSSGRSGGIASGVGLCAFRLFLALGVLLGLEVLDGSLDGVLCKHCEKGKKNQQQKREGGGGGK